MLGAVHNLNSGDGYSGPLPVRAGNLITVTPDDAQEPWNIFSQTQPYGAYFLVLKYDETTLVGPEDAWDL